MLENITGPCDVRFIGEEKYVKLNVDRVWINSLGHILYVKGKDGAVYNWSNIIVIRKAKA